MALTPKQERFVQEYLVDLNATAAAIRAGYKETTAAQQGHNLLRKPAIELAVQAARADLAKRTEVTQDYVIKKLKEIVEKEAADCQDSNLKYSNKIRALELIGKYLGMFAEKGPGRTNDGGNPLEAILQGTSGDIAIDGIQELQQAPATGDDLVE